jgi:bacteriocin-like protein
MTNDIRELSINELDAVSGGAGSISDVMTYVSAYTAALGSIPTPVGTYHCDGPPAPCHPKT